MPFAEPVEQDPGDLCPVFGAAALGLDEAGGDDGLLHVVGGHAERAQRRHGLLHHLAQLLGRRRVLRELVGGREEVALDVALGRGRQPQGRGVLRGGLVVGDRLPAGLGEDREDLGLPPALRDGHHRHAAVRRVGEVGDRVGRLHLLLEGVLAGLDAGTGRVVGGGVGERLGGLDHARREERLGDGPARVAGVDRDLDLGGAGSWIVGVAAEPGEHRPEDGDRRERRRTDEADGDEEDQQPLGRASGLPALAQMAVAASRLVRRGVVVVERVVPELVTVAVVASYAGS